MPSNGRIRGAVLELSEQLVDLGYDVTELVGPLNNDGEEIDPEATDEDTVVNYYLVAEGGGAEFYVALGTNRDYAEVVYQMDVLNHLANFLDESDVETLLDDEFEWDDMEPEETGQVVHKAVGHVIESSEPSTVNHAAFNLSAYASTALVDFHQNLIQGAFPAKFQSVNNLFPYTENVSLKNVDEAVSPVVIAGERGRRYVKQSFFIDNDAASPKEYRFQIAF